MPPAAAQNPHAAAKRPGAAKQVNLERQRKRERDRIGGHKGPLYPGRPLRALPGVKPSSVFLLKCLTGFCLDILGRSSIQHFSECFYHFSFFSSHGAEKMWWWFHHIHSTPPPLWRLSSKESACQCKRHRGGFDPWVGKIPWRTKWQPTLVILPGRSHGQKAWQFTGWHRVGHD